MGSPAEWLARWSYTGLFVALLVEEAGVPLPIPGDLLLVAMGALAAGGAVSAVPTVAVAVAAVTIGSAVLHAVAGRAGRPLLHRAAARLRLKTERLDRAEAFLARGGWAAVAVARWVPGLRIVTSAAAGTFRLPRPAFTAGVVTSAIVWSSACFAVGRLGASGLPALRAWLEGVALWPVAAAAAIPAAALLAWWRRRGRRARTLLVVATLWTWGARAADAPPRAAPGGADAAGQDEGWSQEAPFPHGVLARRDGAPLRQR